MGDPDSGLYVPHILGVILVSSGVANTQVVVTNRSTGDRQIIDTSADKVAIVDAAAFALGYSVDDVIEFNNVGASVGTAIATITNALGGFQEVSLTAAAAPTISINI